MNRWKDAKVALVYDRVNKWGGAERLLLSLHDLFPSAPLFTSVYNSSTAPWASVFDIHTSFLQKIPFFRTHHELIPFLMPFAFESFDFSQFDIVISITSAEAKGIITKPHTLHVCYCLTPTRYLWVMDSDVSYHSFGLLNPLAHLLKKPLLFALKYWDTVASKRPDAYIAISSLVQKRLEKYYGVKAPVVYPPLGEDIVTSRTHYAGEYFLLVSRLVGYKRIDLAIHAANHLQIPLKIVGNGPQLSQLKRIAGSTVSFLGFVPESQLSSIYSQAKAVIIPGEEEFCLTALEAQANGIPVIAYSHSGVAEIIKHGRTGLLFSQQTVSDLVSSIENFSRMKFNPDNIRLNVAKFNQNNFSKNFFAEITKLIK